MKKQDRDMLVKRFKDKEFSTGKYQLTDTTLICIWFAIIINNKITLFLIILIAYNYSF
jgi:hypothetical protein